MNPMTYAERVHGTHVWSRRPVEPTFDAKQRLSGVVFLVGGAVIDNSTGVSEVERRPE